jgi:hypothetical protein
LVGGLALLLAGVLLYSPSHAAVDTGRSPDSFHYTDHPARAATGRLVSLYIDQDFSGLERRQIVSSIRQWNIALNGLVQFRVVLLPDDSSATLRQVKRSGGWIVAKVDSRHPIAQRGEGAQALAVTVGDQGGTRGGFVFVIGDRIGGRDLTSVVMHELGHVLGAGHSRGGLMAPVYTSATSHCIDHEAAMMVASAQRLPANQFNWCVGAGVAPTTRSSLR